MSWLLRQLRALAHAVLGYQAAPLLRLTAEVEAAEADDELAAALTQSARLYLSAGGVVDWRLWSALTPPERVAFARAQRVLEIERARRTGEASAGLMGWLNVGAELDGGEERERTLLDLAVRQVAERRREEVRRAG